jgi:hypothetical protein
VSRKRGHENDTWLTQATIPTDLERTLAPGVGLLIVASVLLVGSYLIVIYLI